jgi:hypothetical protein
MLSRPDSARLILVGDQPIARETSPPVRPRSELRTPIPPSNPQGTQAALTVLIAIAAWLTVAHWRTTVRLILIVMIAFTVYGAITGIDGMRSLMASHHR